MIFWMDLEVRDEETKKRPREKGERINKEFQEKIRSN